MRPAAQMLRLGLGSSGALACGESVPPVSARSANALAAAPSASEGADPGRGPARWRQRRSEYGGAVWRRRVPQASGPSSRSLESEVKKIDDHVDCTQCSSRSPSCSSAIGWRSCRAWATPIPTGRISTACRSGTPPRRRSTRRCPAGWPARSTAASRARGRCGRTPYPRSTSCSWGSRWRPAGGAVAGQARAVPPPTGHAQRRRHRPDRNPGSPVPAESRRARLASPVRRAVQPDHLRQQRASNGCTRTGRPRPSATRDFYAAYPDAWHSLPS